MHQQQQQQQQVFTGWEMKNKYVVKNSMGQQVYYCKEESDNCTRQCCGNNRPFTMHVEDNTGAEVITIYRKYKCMFYGQCCSCSKCCQDVVEIEAPPGNRVGYVKQVYDGCDIKYKIQDDDKKTVLVIRGPNYCKCYCPGDDIPFHVMSKDESVMVGKVTKQWGNFFKEWLTDADNFGITFPIDLDVKIKAVILGAVFLIDFMFFENNNSRGYHHQGYY